LGGKIEPLERHCGFSREKLVGPPGLEPALEKNEQHASSGTLSPRPILGGRTTFIVKRNLQIFFVDQIARLAYKVAERR
jgi:hypothetical protein